MPKPPENPTRRRRRPLATLAALALAAMAVLAGEAHAKTEFLAAFLSRYPSSYRLFSCGTCHRDFAIVPEEEDDDLRVLLRSAASARNAFGKDFEEAGGESAPGAALAAIEHFDSDGDGSSNLAEITSGTGFAPGYRCDTVSAAVNAPADLLWYVDPQMPGCGLETSTTHPLASTTTLLQATSTTAPVDTTSTTLPGADDLCSTPVSGGPEPTAGDCLLVLRTAVGLATCTPACACAPKGSLPTSALDALICLRRAVGHPIALACPCSGNETTTTSTTTTTLDTGTTLPPSTTTTMPPVSTTSTTTTTTTSSTTTTTLASATRGRKIYDGRCAVCHSAGSYDPSGIAPDLAKKGALLVADLSTIDPLMTGLVLTEQEIADLSAFLGGL